MALPIKPCVLVVVVLLLLYTTTPFSSGKGECFLQDAMKNPSYTSLAQDGKIGNMRRRKLIGEDTMMDYDDTGPNPKHDPRKGGGGGRSKGGSP